MRAHHEQAATHGGRFRPRYERQAAAQHNRRLERKTSEADARKDVAATEKKKHVTSLHALVEPVDLTLVEGVKASAGRSVILT
jgi:hypothetical protein